MQETPENLTKWHERGLMPIEMCTLIDECISTKLSKPTGNEGQSSFDKEELLALVQSEHVRLTGKETPNPYAQLMIMGYLELCNKASMLMTLLDAESFLSSLEDGLREKSNEKRENVEQN